MHQLAVHTVGGVITAGEAIMLIVPEADALTVEVEARSRRTSTRSGRARRPCCASPPSTSARRRRSTARSRASRPISPPTSAPARATTRCASRSPRTRSRGSAGLRLIPGMPVEAFIQTGERTVLSYLTKPLTDQINRAFRGR